MLRAALKNLLGHKLRMFLTGFSIILGVSMVSGTYIFTDSISGTFNNLFSDVFDGIDLSVRPKQGDLGGTQGLRIDASIADRIATIDGVEAYAPEVAGIAQLLDKEGNPIGGQGPPTLGFEWTTEPSLQVLKIQENDGRPPQAPNEVAIDKITAQTNNLQVGDKVSIITQVPVEEFTIVGIATFGDAEGLAGATLSAFEISEAQRLFGYDNEYSGIDIKVASNADVTSVQEEITAVIPDNLEVVTGEQQSNEQIDEINQNLGFINTALLAFAGIAIFVGSFIIQNTFRIIVAQRSKELALLRALGARKTQVIRLVIYEAFTVALLASIIGIFCGLIISGGVRALLNSVGFGIPEGDLTIAPRTVIVSLGVGVIVTLLAALLPAIKASRVAPVEALRENEVSSDPKKRSLLKRGLAGTALSLIGVGALIYGLNGSSSQPLYAVGFGVALMFIGVSVVAPLLSIPLASLIGSPLARTRGIPARLARDNAKRTPRRTAATAAALMIGVSLVTMLSIMATTFKSEITRILDDSFPADLTVFSENIGEGGPGTAGFSKNASNLLSTVEGIEDVTAFRYAVSSVRIDGAIIDFFVGADADTFGEVVNLDETEGSFEGVRDGGVLVAKSVADDKGWNIGDKITIEFAKTGEQSFTIAGTFNEAYDSDYIISSESYLKNFGSDDITLLAANVADGQDIPTVKQKAEEALSGYPQLSVQDKGDLFESAEEQIDQVLGLFWGLLAFAVIIAVLGITNTLMLSISERTRELGMLRAIGMTRSQMRRMIRYESIIIALFGAVLGVVMGAFFAWAVLRALESEGISGYVLPIGQIGTYFILAIIAGIIAAAWPARKAARMNVLEAIYHD